MSFLQAQLSDRRRWYEIDGTAGRDWIDAAEFNGASAVEAYEGEVWSVELVTGWGVRASAPGYLDCTPWEVHSTYAAAFEAYTALEAELAGDDDEPDAPEQGSYCR